MRFFNFIIFFCVLQSLKTLLKIGQKAVKAYPVMAFQVLLLWIKGEYFHILFFPLKIFKIISCFFNTICFFAIDPYFTGLLLKAKETAIFFLSAHPLFKTFYALFVKIIFIKNFLTHCFSVFLFLKYNA